MGEFDIIETGFNCADETINFGSRSIAYDTLYEISTIACLKSSEEEVSIIQFVVLIMKICIYREFLMSPFIVKSKMEEFLWVLISH